MTPEQLHKYDSIRPFEPEELPEVFDRLVQNEQFCQVLAYLYPGVPVEAIRQKMHQCKTNLEFQKAFCYGFLKNLLAKASLGCDADFASLDLSKRYTFISNHRDIVLDSALLHVMLFDAGCDTTTEIAIGDNLLKLPWVKDIVRLNKSFIVQRSLPMRQMLAASKLLAEYMHFVIAEKNDNVWIAQREGRAKDSNDRTAEAILKMMTMGGDGSIKERLLSLHLVPLAISYEYDPCDFLKAQEFQLRRDVADWKKGPMDDVVSMQTGIMGYKDTSTIRLRRASTSGCVHCPTTCRRTSSTLLLPSISTTRYGAATACTRPTSWRSTFCAAPTSTPTATRLKTASALRLISTHSSRRYSCQTPTGRSCVSTYSPCTPTRLSISSV